MADATRVARTTLDSGIEVLTERIPASRSAAVGVWVRQGSAHEVGPGRGASHLLEHLVFKGTRRRSAVEIATAVEGLGGSLDAYTGREHTSYQARVLDEHLPVAVDVLADLTQAPLLREEDLELEREVVLEEISTVEDTPDDLVFELHGEALWQDHPYGHSILGTRDTVAAMDVERLRDVHRTRYRGRGLVVAAAGSVDHDDLVGRVSDLFADANGGGPEPDVPEPHPATHRSLTVERPGAQTHMVFGSCTVPHADPRRYALVVLSTAFGGGMSSRLFQRVREELGLAYAVYSFQTFYASAGVAGVYVGTRPEWQRRAEDAVREEYARLVREGLSVDELERACNQVKGHVTLSLESTGARLHRLAGFALRGEPYRDLESVLADIDAVTPDDVAEVAQAFFDPDRQVVLKLGPEEPA